MSTPWAIYGPELYHHGVKGQKWGIRRYQKEDGSLTLRGKLHYGAETQYAKNALSLEIKGRARDEKKYTRVADQMTKKADKATAKGNSEKASKYVNEANIAKGKALTSRLYSNMAKKDLADIKSGTLLAGRDFAGTCKTRIIPVGTMIVTQREYEYHRYTNDEKKQLRKEGKLRS